jgi:hypothetical protein
LGHNQPLSIHPGEGLLSAGERASGQAECLHFPKADVEPGGNVLISTAANGQKQPLERQTMKMAPDEPTVG